MKQIITILLCLHTLLAFSQTENVEHEFKQKLEGASSKNSTISCDFTQTKKVKNIKQPILSSGRFYYDNSGCMALIYTQPQGDKVLMNGEVFTVIANGKKLTGNAASNPMMAQISFMMQACMSGAVGKLGRGWNMSIEREKEYYRVVLTPTDRRVKKYISSMTMLFNAIDITLDQLRIEESAGGYTEYRFENKKLNQKIDSSYFNVE